MSLNFEQTTLEGLVIKQGAETYLNYLPKELGGEIIVRYKLIDSTSRNPTASKRFNSYIGKQVNVTGTLSRTGSMKVIYVRHIKGVQ